MRDSMLAACAMSARSMTSCTELEDNMPNPVEARGHHVAVVQPKIEKRLDGQGPRGDCETPWASAHRRS